jgi:hypothetical protein
MGTDSHHIQGGLMSQNRITIYAGHFGSGKTEIAVNDAFRLAEMGLPVTLIDLDIVKPYFRSRLVRERLADKAIRLIVPSGEHFYADLPIVLPDVKGAIGTQTQRVVMDVGGDDTGARVLGSLRSSLETVAHDFWMVHNIRRPFTTDLESSLHMYSKIEEASGLKITGIISNTHLMQETTLDVVIEGYKETRKLSEALDIRLVCVTVEDRIFPGIDPGLFGCPLVPLTRYILAPFAESCYGSRRLKVVC